MLGTYFKNYHCIFSIYLHLPNFFRYCCESHIIGMKCTVVFALNLINILLTYTKIKSYKMHVFMHAHYDYLVTK